MRFISCSAGSPEYEFLRTGYWAGAAGSAPLELSVPKRPSPIRPDQSFESFVTGEPNVKAWSTLQEYAASARASRAAKTVLLEGPPDHGKSHLLNALRAAWEKNPTSPKSDLISAPQLEVDLALCTEAHSRRKLLSSIASHSLVCLDHVDYMLGNPALAAALPEVVEGALLRGALVIIASQDGAALISRLSKGPLRQALLKAETLTLKPLTRELRTNLLCEFARQQEVRLSQEALTMLTSVSERRSVSDLRGLITQIRAFRRELPHLTQDPLRLVEAPEVRLALLSRSCGGQYGATMGPDALQCGRVSLKALQMAILATFNCDEARFNSRSRARELVFARAVFVYLARTITHPQPSFPEIVRYISCGKSHSTAVTAYQRLQQRLTTDPLEIPPELSFTNNTRSLAEIVGGVEEFAKELTSLSLMKIFGKR